MKIVDKPWYEIIFDHWAQICLLLGIASFIIQKYVDFVIKKREVEYTFKIKKEEIQFSGLQENKILEIKSFFKSYQLLAIALQQYLHQTYFGEHSQEIFKKIDESVTEKFIDFEYNLMTIKLFMDRKDIVTLDEITKTLSTVRTNLTMWHINARNKNPSISPDNLEDILNVIFPKTLPELMTKIEESLRKSNNLID